MAKAVRPSRFTQCGPKIRLGDSCRPSTKVDTSPNGMVVRTLTSPAKLTSYYNLRRICFLSKIERGNVPSSPEEIGLASVRVNFLDARIEPDNSPKRAPVPTPLGYRPIPGKVSPQTHRNFVFCSAGSSISVKADPPLLGGYIFWDFSKVAAGSASR